MKTEPLIWKWEGKSIDLVMNSSGDGPTILLLPALSSISTRHEMRPLQERLSAKFKPFRQTGRALAISHGPQWIGDLRRTVLS